METRTKQSAEQEYEAVLYYDTIAHKKRLKEQINNAKKLVEDTEKGNQKKYTLKILDVDFVPRNLIVAPPKLKKILQKRVAYFGASKGTTIDPITKKEKESKPSFGNRDFEEISGIIGNAAVAPLFSIGDNAKKYISGIPGRKVASQPAKLRVKGPSGAPLYSHRFGLVNIISESSRPPQRWINIEDEVNINIESQPLELILNSHRSMHTQLKSNFVGNEGTTFEISNGSVYIMPKNVIGNADVNEDNATDYSFTEPEKIFAKRLGIRLDQDYKVDLVSGKTNFIFLNKYTWDGEKVIKSRGTNENPGGLINKPYEPYAGSDVAPDVQRTTKANVLVFGHSQAARDKMGGALAKKIKSKGTKVKRIAMGGAPDGAHAGNPLDKTGKGLLGRIRKIKGSYTHAILLLGGNTRVPGYSTAGRLKDQEKYDKYFNSEFSDSAPDYKKAKIDIINHATNIMRIPKENILVMLPPINNNNDYSKSRKLLNERARNFFKSIGVEVSPDIVSGQDDFSDNVHMKGNSEVASKAADEALNNFDFEDFEPPKAAYSKVEVVKIIIEEAEKAGVDPKWAVAVAHAESKFNPVAPNNDGFRGLFQISPRKRY